MLGDTCSVCGLPNDLCVCSDVDKGSSIIEIKSEKRKYGKLWATISGIESDSAEMKEVLKAIKNKLACAGTIKGKNIEILYGRNDRSRELINILVEVGFNRDSIRVS